MPEEEVQRWKLVIARQSVLGQRTYSEIESWLEWAQTSGLGLEGLRAYPSALGAVHRSDIQARLAPCDGNELVTISGPIQQLREQLDAKEISYEVLDWEADRDERMAELDPKRWKKEQRERKHR